MIRRLKVNSWPRRLCMVLMVFFVVASVRWVVQQLADEPEIALVFGEPWEDMRQRSSASIPPAIPDELWFHMPESDARLRFIDPQYGFTTPLARFFTINFHNERVDNIRMSPQVEPLLLDDALKVVLICRSNGVDKAGLSPTQRMIPRLSTRLKGVLWYEVISVETPFGEPVINIKSC